MQELSINMQQEDIKSVIIGDWKGIPFKEYGKQLVKTEGALPQLFGLTNDSDPKIAWRAAYLMDIINEQAPEKLLPFLHELKERLNTEENQSLLRHFTRILGKHDVLAYADGTFIDTCFRQLINKRSAIAVKANFLKLTQQLLTHYPELKHELTEIFELISQDASPAIRCRLKQIIETN